MPEQNWTKIAIAIIIGVALGLIYGWIVDPVEYTDATPSILRTDYQTDYVLMVAEAYQSEQDSSLAPRRLAIMGSETPDQIVKNAIDYATAQGFSPDELTLMQGLHTSMLTYQPVGNPGQ